MNPQHFGFLDPDPQKYANSRFRIKGAKCRPESANKNLLLLKPKSEINKLKILILVKKSGNFKEMCVSNPGSESGLIFFLWGSRIRICIRIDWILALQLRTLLVLQSEKKINNLLFRTSKIRCKY